MVSLGTDLPPTPPCGAVKLSTLRGGRQPLTPCGSLSLRMYAASESHMPPITAGYFVALPVSDRATGTCGLGRPWFRNFHGPSLPPARPGAKWRDLTAVAGDGRAGRDFHPSALISAR
jgi:hypothetical protein